MKPRANGMVEEIVFYHSEGSERMEAARVLAQKLETTKSSTSVSAKVPRLARFLQENADASACVGRSVSVSLLDKAVRVLDTFGSRMTNLNHRGGFVPGLARKPTKISILAFDVANTIFKGANLMQSLYKENVDYVKEVVLPSKGVLHLISNNMDELLKIVADDKREEVKAFSNEVVRFVQYCTDPQLKALYGYSYYPRQWREFTHSKSSKEEVSRVMQELMDLVLITAELYHECQALDKAEEEYHRTLMEEESLNEVQKGSNIQILLQELRRRRKHVRSLKKRSLWCKTFEEVVEKLVDIVQFLHSEVHGIFGCHGKEEFDKQGIRLRNFENVEFIVMASGAYLTRHRLAGTGCLVLCKQQQMVKIIHAAAHPVRSSSALETKAKALAGAILTAREMHLHQFKIFLDSCLAINIAKGICKGPLEVETIFTDLDIETCNSNSIFWCDQSFVTAATWLAKEAMKQGVSLWWSEDFPSFLTDTIYDNKSLMESIITDQSLGPTGLALHYANIIFQIDAMSRTCPWDMRDALYQGLPLRIKHSLRSMLQSFQPKEELTVPQVKAVMEKTLQWLVPLANNTINAHLGFWRAGDWANTGTKSTENTAGYMFNRIETLHHADKEKAEALILELVVWLHYLISQSRPGSNITRTIPKFNFIQSGLCKHLRTEVLDAIDGVNTLDGPLIQAICIGQQT